LTGLSSGSGNSGSTAWSNSVRSRLYLQRITDDGHESDPDARLLTTVKANYGRTGGEIRLRWQDGVFEAEAGASNLDRAAGSAKAERVFLALLRAYEEQGRHVSPSPSASYAPSRFAKDADAEGVTKRALEAAMNSLFAKKAIRVEEPGPASRRVKAIVEVGNDR
jgi:RecA-family ATPase